jgi:hypothetical protein
MIEMRDERNRGQVNPRGVEEDGGKEEEKTRVGLGGSGQRAPVQRAPPIVTSTLPTPGSVLSAPDLSLFYSSTLWNTDTSVTLGYETFCLLALGVFCTPPPLSLPPSSSLSASLGFLPVWNSLSLRKA